jgi:hypothetical protein
MGAPQADGLGNAKASEPHSGLGPTGAIPSAKHTSGPWQRKNDYDGFLTIIGNVDGESFSDGTTSYSYDFIANCEDEYGEPASAANVRLILAAPELYSELERAVRFLRAAPLESGVCCCGNPIEGHGYSDGHSPVDELQYHSSGLVESLEAALAKARGDA